LLSSNCPNLYLLKTRLSVILLIKEEFSSVGGEGGKNSEVVGFMHMIFFRQKSSSYVKVKEVGWQLRGGNSRTTGKRVL
jgi:hypothetical protein